MVTDGKIVPFSDAWMPVPEAREVVTERRELDAMSLSLTNVDVVYGGVIQVLRSANLEVPEDKIVVLLGSNGAGKTTTLRAISGLLRGELGEVTAGEIQLDGETSPGSIRSISSGAASSRCWRAARCSSI